jgi:two-component system nitrogen regulation response regulator NtrX
MAPDNEINAEIVEKYLQHDPAASQSMSDQRTITPYLNQNFKEAKKEFEREYLVSKIQENNGNISQTAEMLGLERSHLHKKLKALNIETSGSD